MRDTPEEVNYRVVVNDEGQYSIWLAYKPLPVGWSDARKNGSRDECLAYIKEIWTDLRPLSLRTRLAKND